MEEISTTMIQVRDFAIVAIAIMGFVVLLGNVITSEESDYATTV